MQGKWTRLFWLTSLVTTLAGCGGGGSSSTTPPPRTLSGTITYDKVFPTASGLDYANTARWPTRGVRVELLDSATSAVITTGFTDSLGHYAFTWPGTGARMVKVRIKAATATPVIRVQDNTNGGALWASDSPPFDSDTGSVMSLNVPSGWDGASYTGVRSAAPFAVLDAAYAAAHAFLAERAVMFPDLTINWSPNNRPEPGDLALGQIVTSHWRNSLSQLFILGKEDVDTDEYDSHIIAHEWGHYFESKLSRSDSPGNSHRAGDRKDPRLAWGEGWANAFGAIVFYPNTVYTDTSGLQQTFVGLAFNLEDNTDSDPNPGWFSEMSVAHVFHDLWDPASGAEPFDSMSLPLGAIYDVMVGPQKATPAFTTLFSFIDALKIANPASAAAIDTLLAYRGIASPVTDPAGSGETHDGGLVGVLPVYNELIINAPQTPLTFTSVGVTQDLVLNELGSNRFAAFVGGGSAVTVSAATSGPDVLVQVFQSGQGIALAGGTPAAATNSIPTTAGVIYTVVVSSSDATPGNVFPGAIRVTSP